MKTAGKNVENDEESEILKEVEGIGTEATRAGIIETIKKNGYIEIKKNIVSVTKKGIVLCEAIEGTVLSSPSMTAKWESYLKKIGEGNGAKDAFLNNITKFLGDLIRDVPEKLASEKMQSVVKEEQVSIQEEFVLFVKRGLWLREKRFLGAPSIRVGVIFLLLKPLQGRN